jgi:hypothetical protein
VQDVSLDVLSAYLYALVLHTNADQLAFPLLQPTIAATLLDKANTDEAIKQLANTSHAKKAMAATLAALADKLKMMEDVLRHRIDRKASVLADNKRKRKQRQRTNKRLRQEAEEEEEVGQVDTKIVKNRPGQRARQKYPLSMRLSGVECGNSSTAKKPSTSLYLHPHLSTQKSSIPRGKPKRSRRWWHSKEARLPFKCRVLP